MNLQKMSGCVGKRRGNGAETRKRGGSEVGVVLGLQEKSKRASEFENDQGCQLTGTRLIGRRKNNAVTFPTTAGPAGGRMSYQYRQVDPRAVQLGVLPAVTSEESSVAVQREHEPCFPGGSSALLLATLLPSCHSKLASWHPGRCNTTNSKAQEPQLPSPKMVRCSAGHTIHHAPWTTAHGIDSASLRFFSFSFVADAHLASSAQGKRCVSAPKGRDDCHVVLFVNKNSSPSSNSPASFLSVIFTHFMMHP